MVGLGLLLALVAMVWWLGDPAPGPTADRTSGPASDRTMPAGDPGDLESSARLAAVPPRRSAEADLPEHRAPVAAALDAMALRDAFRLRCETELSDGLYEALPGSDAPTVRFVTVRDGELFAAAWASSGEVWVAHELQRVARLSWGVASEGWSGCSVDPVELVDVSGVVHFGTSAGIHTVPGCRAGEVEDLGEDGAFTLEAAVGSVCHLMVVVEQGELFGRGEHVAVHVDGPTDGIELYGPTDEELWTLRQQTAIAAKLVQMGDARVAERQAQTRPELDIEREGAEGALARAWAEQEEQRLTDMLQQLDDLEDPEHVRAYLVTAFLGLY